MKSSSSTQELSTTSALSRLLQAAPWDSCVVLGWGCCCACVVFRAG